MAGGGHSRRMTTVLVKVLSFRNRPEGSQETELAGTDTVTLIASPVEAMLLELAVPVALTAVPLTDTAVVAPLTPELLRVSLTAVVIALTSLPSSTPTR